MGTGHYEAPFHPGDMDLRKETNIAQVMVRDIKDGVGDTGICSGIIGEIGCSWPWTDGEKESVRAAVIAQQMIGAALMVHPGRHQEVPQEIVKTLLDLGADIERTIMAHTDRTVFDFEAMVQLAESGCCLEFDMFGEETSYYPQNPSILKQILISQDISFKIQLVHYGGYGFAHILGH
jgi:phosphotriesterase-related protein